LALIERTFKASRKLRKPLNKFFKTITNFFKKSYWTFYSTSIFGERNYLPSEKDYLDSYEASFLVNTCVKKIAEKVANTQFKLYKVTGTTNKEKIKEVPNHRLLDLLAQVNPFMTQFEMLEMTQTYEELLGNSYWLKVRGERSKLPVELWQLRPDWVKVVEDPKRIIKGYEYRIPNGTKQFFEPDDVIHFKQPNPKSSLYGLSTTAAAMDIIKTAVFTARWNRNFFENSARPDTLLVTKNKMTPKAKEELEKRWYARYGGVKNAHRLGVLEGEVNIKTLTATMRDMEFSKLTLISRDQILTAFGVPKPIVAVTDDVNRANAEAAIYAFLSETIEPKIRRIVERLNEFLVPEFGDDLYLDFVDPTPENREAITKEYETALKNNWMVINEVRDREGLPPLEGGWDFYLPITVMPGGGLEQTKSIRIKGITEKAHKKAKEEREQERLRNKVLTGKRSLKLKMKLKEELRNLFILQNNNKPKKLDAEGRKKYYQEHVKSLISDGKMFAALVRRLLKKQEETIQEAVESEFLGKSLKLSDCVGDASCVVAKNKYDLIDWDIQDRVFFEISVPIFTDITERRGKRVARLLGTEFVLTDRVRKFIERKAFKFAHEVNSTTKSKLRKTLSEGVKEGEGVKELSERVSEVFRIRRGAETERIARTEVLSASNEADLESYIQSGVVEKKEWLATLDDRVRPWHAEMDGEVAKVGEKFSNGMMFPGDPSAPADDTINCRCTTLPVVET